MRYWSFLFTCNRVTHTLICDHKLLPVIFLCLYTRSPALDTLQCSAEI